MSRVCGLGSMAGAGRAFLSFGAVSIAASFCGGVIDSVASDSCLLRRLKPLAGNCGMFSVLDLFWLELAEIIVFAGATVTVVGVIPMGRWTTTSLLGILRSGADIFVEGMVEDIAAEIGVGEMEVGAGACDVN